MEVNGGLSEFSALKNKQRFMMPRKNLKGSIKNLQHPKVLQIIKRWFFKEPFTELFFVEPKIILIWL